MFYTLMYAFFLGFRLPLGGQIWDSVSALKIIKIAPNAEKQEIDPLCLTFFRN